MKKFYQRISLMGRVCDPSPKDARFKLKLASGGDPMEVNTSITTYYEILRNAGESAPDSIPKPSDADIAHLDKNDPKYDAKINIIRYLKPGQLVSLQGILSQDDKTVIYDARRIVLMHASPDKYLWEGNHWWLRQIDIIFEQWMDVLFQDRRDITVNDFAQFYRTNLNILGGPTNSAIQESATLSRFIYGLSSTFLMTGNRRALSAARAGAYYLIDAYSIPVENEYILWKFGRDQGSEDLSTRQVRASLNGDDAGTYALYEQIYALAGLTQYYRATQDTWVLRYIDMTVAGFLKYFADGPMLSGDKKAGGFFSHIDSEDLSYDSPSLERTNNRSKKNWNSVGDHIPAYMINLIISLDPLPDASSSKWEELLNTCRDILEECVVRILDHFPPKDGSKMVEERFDKEWNPDHGWSWQKNRGIVGHNYKISWNLVRCGHYYRGLAADETCLKTLQDHYAALADRCYTFAAKLANDMSSVGMDLIRGGIYDALERKPTNGLLTEFAWSNTKDFWQQEQSILAYYILGGVTAGQFGVTPAMQADFLEMARYCAAFWNLYFVDHDQRKIYFRTTDDGMPVVQGEYGIQAGHAIAGYHAFELNYLAHIYVQAFGKKEAGIFTMHYCPLRNNGSPGKINVLPDFMPPGHLAIRSVRVDGRLVDDNKYTSSLMQLDLDEIGAMANSVVEVKFAVVTPKRQPAPPVESQEEAIRSFEVETTSKEAPVPSEETTSTASAESPPTPRARKQFQYSPRDISTQSNLK